MSNHVQKRKRFPLTPKQGGKKTDHFNYSLEHQKGKMNIHIYIYIYVYTYIYIYILQRMEAKGSPNSPTEAAPWGAGTAPSPGLAARHPALGREAPSDGTCRLHSVASSYLHQLTNEFVLFWSWYPFFVAKGNQEENRSYWGSAS